MNRPYPTLTAEEQHARLQKLSYLGLKPPTMSVGRLGDQHPQVLPAYTGPESQPLLQRLRGLLPQHAITTKDAGRLTELIANQLRRELHLDGVTLTETVIRELPWIVAIERRPLKGRAGMSMQVSGGWVIVINSQEPVRRARFSLAHELCHTILAEHGATILPSIAGYASHKRVERLCDTFAAQLLLPRHLVAADWRDGIKDVEILAGRYMVSEQSMAFRLREMGILKPEPRCPPEPT